MNASLFEPATPIRSWNPPALLLCLLSALGGAGCERASRADSDAVITSVQALTPASTLALAAATTESPTAPAPEPPTSPEQLVREAFEQQPARCPEVAQQARELSAGLPRKLDSDTLATAVTASGCDLTLEYELVTLDAKDVSEKGLRAVRRSVQSELCADHGALAVMQHGGRFTNVYYDRSHTRIGLFSVAADDCGI